MSSSTAGENEDFEILIGPDLTSDLPHEILGVPRYDPSRSRNGRKTTNKSIDNNDDDEGLKRTTSIVKADSVGEGDGVDARGEGLGYECFDVVVDDDTKENDYDAIVERAYRDLARKYHPRNSGNDDISQRNADSTTIAMSPRGGSVTGVTNLDLETDVRRTVTLCSTALWAANVDKEEDYKDNNPMNTTMSMSENSDDSHDDDDDERKVAFLKITRAYKALKNCIRSEQGCDDRQMKMMMETMSQKDAQDVYESKYGPYRDMYYSEAGMIGIPYAADLKEMWRDAISPATSSMSLRDRLSIQLFVLREKQTNDEWVVRMSFFRTIFLKKDMNFGLCLLEILLTWTVIAFCVMAFLVDINPDIWPAEAQNDGQIINIVGGVSLMAAQFVVSFWYGFTHYPAGGKLFFEWLNGRATKTKRTVEEQDMEDIRDVCSQSLHQDRQRRFSPWILVACLPVAIVDQTIAWIASAVTRIFLFIFRVSDEGTMSYSIAVSKTVCALAIVVGQYCLWMYGNIFCKVSGVVALLMSQKLYTAILFQLGPFEFVQTVLFGNFVLLTRSKSKAKKPRQYAKMTDIEACVDGESGFSGDKKEEAEEASQSEELPPSLRITVFSSVLRRDPKYSTPRVDPLYEEESVTKQQNRNSLIDDASYDESLELSYIEKDGTLKSEESFDEEVVDRARSGTAGSVGTSAAEILEDLNTLSHDDDEGSPHIVAMYKATKRRLEETYFSNRNQASFADQTNQTRNSRSFDESSMMRIASLSSAFSAGTDTSRKPNLIQPLQTQTKYGRKELDEGDEQDSLMLMKAIDVFQDDSRSLNDSQRNEEKMKDGRDYSCMNTSRDFGQNHLNRSLTWAGGSPATALSLSGGRASTFNQLFQRSGTHQQASRRNTSSIQEYEPDVVVENIRIVGLHSHDADDDGADANFPDNAYSIAESTALAGGENPIEACCMTIFR